MTGRDNERQPKAGGTGQQSATGTWAGAQLREQLRRALTGYLPDRDRPLPEPDPSPQPEPEAEP